MSSTQAHFEADGKERPGAHVAEVDVGPNPLAQAVQLPHSGRTLRNRLVKISMAEDLAYYGGEIDLPAFQRLYSAWAEGGWAMVVTGNVHIDPRYSALPWDVRLPWDLAPPPPARVRTDDRTRPWAALVDSFRTTAAAADGNDKAASPPLFIVQLSHPGRQCPPFCRPWLARPVAPSAIRVDAQPGSRAAALFHRLAFRTPRALRDGEVEEVCRRFGEAAALLEASGVDGIQVHGAHGYLVAQFLSPLSNHRPPSSPFALRPADPAHAHHLLRRLLFHIRSSTGPAFTVGIKLVCGEFVEGGLGPDEAMGQVRAAREMRVKMSRTEGEREEGWDFVDVSGGSYANPVFTSTAGPHDAFLAFTRALLELSPPSPTHALVLLSGSLRTYASLVSTLSLSSPSADLLGFGRPAVLHPSLPRTHLLADPPTDVPAHRIAHFAFWSAVLSLGGRIKIVGGGVGTLWWDWQMGRLARGEGVRPAMGIAWGAWGAYGSAQVAAVLIGIVLGLLAILLDLARRHL